ncbi:hypothetical protein GCM10010372_40680 [Streptomyces tauricus]|nr:hypothetical protein GCM10010372_40680 [Streptomyces tauricus]
MARQRASSEISEGVGAGILCTGMSVFLNFDYRGWRSPRVQRGTDRTKRSACDASHCFLGVVSGPPGGPAFPRPHLRLVQPLVRTHCGQLGIPYAETRLVGSYSQALTHTHEESLSGSARGAPQGRIRVAVRNRRERGAVLRTESGSGR